MQVITLSTYVSEWNIYKWTFDSSFHIPGKFAYSSWCPNFFFFGIIFSFGKREVAVWLAVREDVSPFVLLDKNVTTSPMAMWLSTPPRQHVAEINAETGQQVGNCFPQNFPKHLEFAVLTTPWVDLCEGNLALVCYTFKPQACSNYLFFFFFLTRILIV